jgi:hypothetical protein
LTQRFGNVLKNKLKEMAIVLLVQNSTTEHGNLRLVGTHVVKERRIDENIFFKQEREREREDGWCTTAGEVPVSSGIINDFPNRTNTRACQRRQACLASQITHSLRHSCVQVPAIQYYYNHVTPSLDMPKEPVDRCHDPK